MLSAWHWMGQEGDLDFGCLEKAGRMFHSAAVSLHGAWERLHVPGQGTWCWTLGFIAGREGGERGEGEWWLLVFTRKAQVFWSLVVRVALELRHSAKTVWWDMVCAHNGFICHSIASFHVVWMGKSGEFTAVLWLWSVSVAIRRLKNLPCLAASFAQVYTVLTQPSWLQHPGRMQRNVQEEQMLPRPIHIPPQHL